MSDRPAGSDWWLASDGRWYPPAAPDSTGQARAASPPSPSGGQPARRRGWRTWHVVVIAAVALLAGVGIGAVAGSEDESPSTIRAADDGEATSAEESSDRSSSSRRTTSTERVTTTDRTTTTRPRTTTTEAPEVGTRANPLPLGQTAAATIEGREAWRIRVLSFTPNANDAVAAENQFNSPPGAGLQFAMVSIEVTYVGEEEPRQIVTDLQFSALDDGNVTYDLQDRCGVIPGELDEYVDVYRNGVVTGNVCWAVATDKVESLVMIVAPRFGGEPYFMALR